MPTYTAHEAGRPGPEPIAAHDGRRVAPWSVAPGAGSRVALVLGGGNALGAYLAGAYERLHEEGVRPDRIVGASIGAVTGAILAGSAPEHRLEKLQAFWAEARQPTFRTPPAASRRGRQIYNGAHTALAVLLGRPGIFRHRYPGLWSVLPGVPDDVALFDHAPLRQTLERLVDFDRLNRAEVPFTLACTDLETGEDVYFHNTRDEIRPEHLLASAALSPLFPPVEVGGRLLGDPGYANNLPLDPVFDPVPDQDLVCVAIDLFGLASPRPKSLDAILERTQDMVFAGPGRRRIEGLRREYALRQELHPGGPRVGLVYLAYQAAGHELAGKTLDFSPSSIRDRWAAGRRDMASGLALLAGASTGDGRLFEYFAVDAREAAVAAEAGAPSAPDPVLDRVA
jgi:NTE family protein